MDTTVAASSSGFRDANCREPWVEQHTHLLHKVLDGDGHVELVRVGVLLRGLEMRHHLGPVLKVLRGVRLLLVLVFLRVRHQ